MNAATIEMLARILASHAEMYGMVSANQQRIFNGHSLAYDELAFSKVADNLRIDANTLAVWRRDGIAQ